MYCPKLIGLSFIHILFIRNVIMDIEFVVLQQYIFLFFVTAIALSWDKKILIMEPLAD